ncbi:RAB6-interacting golgin [Nephila pilipes]|uniref:RAB6-interacting golgin n=1 Tax=Nephila pilipes TaxID=299642 RepID=A0A8X6NP50_NEPPI|nr:RAB6-interacting golgin [Nephila pilipes]
MASEKWAGFTDEDIEKIKTNSSNKKNTTLKESAGPLKVKDVAAKTLRHKDLFTDSSKDETSDSDPDLKRKPHKLKKNSKLREFPVPDKALDETPECNKLTHEKCTADLSDDSYKSSENSEKENYGEKILENDQNSSMAELELFEMRRKRIEAENARRRALINKAITDKKMQTQAEAIKLAKITQELNRLDSILSADVSILRDYIEEASLDFTKAEKRYLKAEKEFIEAKLQLYEKMQRKEQLTEHLCAIIEQNENRKANKLVELMKQLEMEAIIEDCEINDTQPILSKLCLLNDEAYHCCQTLKPSQKVPSDGYTHEDDGISVTLNEENQESKVCKNSMENENLGMEKSTASAAYVFLYFWGWFFPRARGVKLILSDDGNLNRHSREILLSSPFAVLLPTQPKRFLLRISYQGLIPVIVEMGLHNILGLTCPTT